MNVSQTNNLATMINVFTVEPEKQQELIELWLKEGKQFEALPGFISATLHPILAANTSRVSDKKTWTCQE